MFWFKLKFKRTNISNCTVTFMYSLDNRINVIFCVSGTLCSSSLSKCVAAIGRDVNSSHLAVDISICVTVMFQCKSVRPSAILN